MEKYKIKVKEIADFYLNSFCTSECALPGNNGPYGEEDTPVRNTAHWCVAYSYLFDEYHEEKYRNIIRKFADYLMDEKNYGITGAIKCRKVDGCDDTNGIIGQAWVIEGLIAAYKVLNDERLINKAINIFNSQPFDKEKGLWRVRMTDGRTIGYDYVYNHQLWFAAAGGMISTLYQDEDIRNKVCCFLDKSKSLFAVQPSGKLYHLINHDTSILGKAKFFIKAVLTDWNIGDKYKKMNYLETGYHLFDLYGFALLKKIFPDHKLFKSMKLKKAIDFGMKPLNLALFDKQMGKFNTYGYPYNSPAFEYPYVAKILGNGCNAVYAKELLNVQFKEFFDTEFMMFTKKNKDPYTLTARLYELIRYFYEEDEHNV